MISLIGYEYVDAQILESALDPVMARHDAYVAADASLDDLDAAVYLGSTERLRALFEAIPDRIED